jgi:hypothetical protein
LISFLGLKVDGGFGGSGGGLNDLGAGLSSKTVVAFYSAINSFKVSSALYSLSLFIS